MLENNTRDDWYSISKFIINVNKQFTENQLRWALRYRDENGLAKHVRKFGKSLYISRSGFFEWFEQQGTSNNMEVTNNG
jgi:hypothetical protein